MTRPALIALTLLAAAGLAAATTRRPSLAGQIAPQDLWSGAAASVGEGAGRLADAFTFWTDHAQSEPNGESMQHATHLPTQIAAMLAAIKHAEGTTQAADPYRVCYGYRHTVQDLADHPAVTGEWRGEKLPARLCLAAGRAPGCVSTAAGAYQFIRPTWDRLKAKLRLPDFGPDSQDAAATELLRERGALVHLERGDFARAVAAARREWASLPGSGWSQPERSLQWLTARFTAAGGVTA